MRARNLVFVLLTLALPTAVSAQPVLAVSTGSTPGTATLGAEALLWWFEKSPAPVPLVTDGIVGLAATDTLLGGQSLGTGANPGFRINGGYAVSGNWGVEGSVFYIPKRSTSRSVSSTGQIGSTDLILPYRDAATGQETGTELSFAPLYAGSATETLETSLLGAELNGAWVWSASASQAVDVIAGFRYLRLEETYSFATSSPYIPPFPVDIWTTTDRFATTNNFYGAQAGLRARWDQGTWFGTAAAKVALGAMVQQVDVSGSLATNDYTNFGAVQNFVGGYFALPSNIGNHSRTQFAVVPEVSLNLGLRLTPQAAIFVGYSFLYASNVVRPGNQVNRTINPTQSTSYTEDPTPTPVGPAQPAFAFSDSGFWAQGVNLGVAIRF